MNGTKILTSAKFGGFVLPVKSVSIIALGVLILFLTLGSGAYAKNARSSRRQKIPVIFDTDIGGDIDDTWALALLVQSPEFDVKLVTTATGDTRAKAEIVAKFLQTVGRTDIPVGIGVRQGKGGHRQQEWTKDYKLSSYPGSVYQDGVQAIVDTIMNSAKPIKVVAVGPLPNIGAAQPFLTRLLFIWLCQPN